MKPVTLQDLANTLGVARSTVSRALRDDPQISPTTREHVHRLARQLGYRPNAAARALTRRHSGVVGVVLPRSAPFVFANPYFASLLEGIASVAEEAGLPMLLSSSPSPDHERWLREARVDGLVALGHSLDEADLEGLESLATGSSAIALVGTPLRDTGLPVVEAAEAPGIEEACRHLADTGYTDVALVRGPPGAAYARARAETWRSAAEDAGLRMRVAVDGDDTHPGGARAAQRLLALRPRPEAWVFGNDAMAFGALCVLRGAGVRVPEETALVGFDDVPAAALVGLSTVHQPIRALGAHAMRIVVAALRGEAAPEQTFRTHLEPRITTRSPAGDRATEDRR